MRTETEMLALIVDTAKQDERIRAVLLNGSRANPNAQRDLFQDYDIVYIVRDPSSFRRDPAWIDRFGDRMILQRPEEMDDPPPGEHERFAYLMQLADGNRIDLTIFPLAKLEELNRDSLTLALLDKDGILGPVAPPSESDYLPRPPSAKEYSNCCNEFWWCCPYAAKGLWREQITYAKFMADSVVHGQLMKMLAWYIGVRTGFSKNLGAEGKYFRKYLEPELWDLLQTTYADAEYNRTWDALLAMGNLFRRTAVPVGEHFGFPYPFDEDRKVSAHMKHVRNLPKNAREMY
jgi:aminoglycoside 6-adenylyltransferase